MPFRMTGIVEEGHPLILHADSHCRMAKHSVLQEHLPAPEGKKYCFYRKNSLGSVSTCRKTHENILPLTILSKSRLIC